MSVLGLNSGYTVKYNPFPSSVSSGFALRARSGKGLNLTVHPLSRPNTDTVYYWTWMLQYCSINWAIFSRIAQLSEQYRESTLPILISRKVNAGVVIENTCLVTWVQNIVCNIAWAVGPRALAIFHRISLLLSHYRFSVCGVGLTLDMIVGYLNPAWEPQTYSDWTDIERLLGSYNPMKKVIFILLN